jgi:hypothetical protein
MKMISCKINSRRPPEQQHVVAPQSINVCTLRSNSWNNPDVHARTNELNEQLKLEFQDLPKWTVESLPLFRQTCDEIIQFYNSERGKKIIIESGDSEKINKNEIIAEMNKCIEKMKSRESVLDKDLSFVSPSGLLVMIWKIIIKINSNESYVHFALLLYDMSHHCVQGDSHRLFSSFVALMRDGGYILKKK